jgi:tetratricopeptide (TPR) repeat protein
MFHTLEQAYTQLDGDDKIMAVQAAYSIKPDLYKQNLINVLLTKANTLVNEGAYEQAIPIYQRVIAQFPGQSNPYIYLAWAYYLDGQDELALESIQGGWDLAGEDAGYYLEAAKIYQGLSLTDRALQAYQTALAIDPQSDAAIQGILDLKGGDE